MHKELCETFRGKAKFIREMMSRFGDLGQIEKSNLYEARLFIGNMHSTFYGLYKYFMTREYVQWYSRSFDSVDLEQIEKAVKEQIKFDFKKKTATFRGVFAVSDNDMTYIPKGFIVDGELHLWNSELKELPDDLRVTGDVNLSDPAARHLLKQAQNLKKAGQIGGKVILA